MDTVALTMRMAKTDRGEWRDCIAQDWPEYLHAQDIHPVLVPNDPEECIPYLKGVRALILSGGDDIILRQPDDASDDPRALRDRTEYVLLQAAISRSLPVLGVCRGMQFINGFFGGSLRPIEGHVGIPHNISFNTDVPGGLFPSETMRVNSYHALGIADLGEGLKSFASAPDGSIEGVRHAEHRIVGVMWHPERPERQAGLVRRFIDFSR